ncbi:MAG: hypothetical protein K2J85_03830, partial [Anaeroplasmataceae bacterium]|nr:hypothetical protein [Anaeroplasmataceae bacterium]
MKKRRINLKTLVPIVKRLVSSYKLPCFIVLICLIISAISNIAASVFLQQIISVIETALDEQQGSLELFKEIQPKLFQILIVMVSLYAVGIISSIVYNQIMAAIG